jgi:hypothetical protein
MIQTPTSHCDCCGLPVNPLTMEDCPRCNYPVNPAKEERFLESALNDLQRVASHGGANLRVVDLIQRYQSRLNNLHHLKMFSAPAVPPVVIVPGAPAISVAPPVWKGTEAIPTPIVPPLAPQEAPVNAAMVPANQQRPPRRVFSWRSFFADQAINIVASLGAFLLLVGSLSFTATTSSLLLSFMVVFAVHAVFGITGFITYRFPTFRIVATIYTVIFALLVPLVGFSAYRLVTGSNIGFSIPVLVAIAAVYAAIVYTVLALYQHFIPFAYLGMVALVVADLAVANALKLAIWWWPGMAMLLAVPALIAIRRPSGGNGPFTGSWAILRDPVRYVMYAIVVSSILGLVSTLVYSIQLDVFGTSLQEVRFSVLSMTALLLLWTGLYLWLTKRTRSMIVLAYLFLTCVLAFCYAFGYESIGYALALTGVALLYHALSRFGRRLLQPFGLLALGLDQIALVLVFLVPFISSSLLPAQLFARAYLPTLTGTSSLLHFQTSWQMVAELIAVALGLTLSVSVTFNRAGFAKTPLKASWCWLLLLSGFLLNWEYSIVVLALNVTPVWAFLGLALAIIAGAVIIRRFFGTAWANPLDVLALTVITFTLSLGLNQSQDVISILLLSFATLIYVVLLYQRRQNWLLLPLAFSLLALPTLWDRPFAMLLLGVLLPLASVAIHRLLSNKWHASHAAILTSLHLANIWEWPLLVAGLVYGVMLSAHDVAYSTSSIQNGFSVNFPVALELAFLSLTWYASAALTRMKLWLVPSVGFATGALLIPTNSFWVLVSLTPVLALLGIGISHFAGRDWALPLYIAALLAALMSGYAGFTENHLVALAWALLGFAALAYIIGIVENTLISMWIMPLLATWSVIVSAGFLDDLYRPPIVALLCAALGISISFLNFLPIPLFGSWRSNKFRWYALPFYATALAAAVLTGIYGTLADINRPFYGAVPDAMLAYAVMAFAVLIFEQQPRWLWLVAGFAIWGTSLALKLTAYYMLGIGLGMAVIALLIGFMTKRFISKTSLPASLQLLQKFTWSWPWYASALLAAILIGAWTSLPVNQPQAGFIGYSLLTFTALAIVVMLVERIPGMLVFPSGLAAWTIWLWQPPLDLAPLMIAYSLLCALVFATQFAWRIVPPASRWLPSAIPHVILGLGGQVLVVLVIIGQGGLSAGSGLLVHVGAGALLELAILLFWYGSLHKGIIARNNVSVSGPESEGARLKRARAVQHWCFYAAGLLLSLVVSWELSTFHQTRFDVLALAPASYFSIIAPFLMRDETLPERHWAGQVVSLLGAALLLLPALWLSFSDSNLAPTLILAGESIALLLLGIAARSRIFVLSSASLLVVGTLRALFLSTPPALALMVLGGLLVAIATTLFLIRHKLQLVWTRWE